MKNKILLSIFMIGCAFGPLFAPKGADIKQKQADDLVGFISSVGAIPRIMATPDSELGDQEKRVKEALKQCGGTEAGQKELGQALATGASGVASEFIKKFSEQTLDGVSDDDADRIGDKFGRKRGKLEGSAQASYLKTAYGKENKKLDEAQDEVADRAKKLTNKLLSSFSWRNPHMSLFMGYFAGATACSIALCTAAYYGPKFLYEKLVHALKNPGFIAETDQIPFLMALFKSKPEIGSMKDLYFKPDFQKEVDAYAEQLKFAVKSGSKDGTMAVFYGPYGTGKTELAPKIFRQAGLKYAFIRGGSIRSNKDFAKQLGDKFEWARRNGVGFVIDEAEALLGANLKSDKDKMILNNLIELMGTPQKRPHMIILTNHPQKINGAFGGTGGRIEFFLKFPALDRDIAKGILSKKIPVHARAVGLKVDGLSLDAVVDAVGLNPGRDINSIVRQACIMAKMTKQPLSPEIFGSVSKRLIKGREDFATFELPSRTPVLAQAVKA